MNTPQEGAHLGGLHVLTDAELNRHVKQATADWRRRNHQLSVLLERHRRRADHWKRRALKKKEPAAVGYYNALSGIRQNGALRTNKTLEPGLSLAENPGSSHLAREVAHETNNPGGRER